MTAHSNHLWARMSLTLPRLPTSLYEPPYIANTSDWDVRYVSLSSFSRAIPFRTTDTRSDRAIRRHYANVSNWDGRVALWVGPEGAHVPDEATREGGKHPSPKCMSVLESPVAECINRAVGAASSHGDQVAREGVRWPFCTVSCLATASSAAGMRAGTIRAWPTSSVTTARPRASTQVGTICEDIYVDRCTGVRRVYALHFAGGWRVQRV